jgi:hypothetical protein
VRAQAAQARWHLQKDVAGMARLMAAMAVMFKVMFKVMVHWGAVR